MPHQQYFEDNELQVPIIAVIFSIQHHCFAGVKWKCGKMCVQY